MSIPLILDSSATLAWLLPDETNEQVDVLFHTIAVRGAYVPSLWALEVGNGLLVAERRKRISRHTRLALIQHLKDLPIEVDPHTSDYAFHNTSTLAEKYGLTLYDAAYLELALRLKGHLATLDAALIKAAQREKVLLTLL